MFMRFPFTSFLISVFTVTVASLSAEPPLVDAVKTEATGVSQKRFTQKMWGNKEKSGLMDKSFPFKQWDSHYSSLGSKRSGISVSEGESKKEFKTQTKEFPMKDIEISKWGNRMADLEKDARISTDDSAKKIADQRLYGAMLQDTQQYEEMGKELSLRDINRYQFRKNHSPGAVPVSGAGTPAKDGVK